MLIILRKSTDASSDSTSNKKKINNHDQIMPLVSL